MGETLFLLWLSDITAVLMQYLISIANNSPKQKEQSAFMLRNSQIYSMRKEAESPHVNCVYKLYKYACRTLHNLEGQ